MEVQATNTQPVSSQTTTAGANPAAELGPDDFLRLLVTQLENQDPLDPMDSEQFTSQLTQFNSLDQLIEMNRKLETVAASQTALANLQTTMLIGREVTAEGNQLYLDSDGASPIYYNLQTSATRVVVNITDLDGSLVRTLELGAQDAGEQTLSWDGKDNAGLSVPPGVYDFEVNPFDVAGEKVGVVTRIQGIVTGVSLADGEPMLSVGDLELPVSAVTSVTALSGT